MDECFCGLHHEVVRERVKRLEDQTEFETSEDDARIKELDNRIKVLETDEDDARIIELTENLAGTSNAIMILNERISRLENRLKKDDDGEPFEVWTDRQLEKLASIVRELDSRLDDKLTEADSRLVQLERRHRTLVESSNDWNSQFGKRLVEVEAALRGYGVPVNNPPRMSKSKWAELYEADDALNSEKELSRNEAYEQGRADAMRQAERRIVEHGRRMMWSAMSTQGVVRAIKNPELDEDYKGLIADHVFQANAVDPHHCARVISGEKCGYPVIAHKVSSFKPIQDNPQA